MQANGNSVVVEWSEGVFNTLNRCDCGHLDIEHQLLLRPDFSPIGAGACNVCGEEYCNKFNNPNLQPVQPKPTPDTVQPDETFTLEDVVHETQQVFIKQMIDDPEFFSKLQSLVLFNRLQFLDDVHKGLLESDQPNHAAIASVTQDMVKAYTALYRLEPVTSVVDRWARVKLLVLLNAATMVAKFKQVITNVSIKYSAERSEPSEHGSGVEEGAGIQDQPSLG